MTDVFAAFNPSDTGASRQSDVGPGRVGGPVSADINQGDADRASDLALVLRLTGYYEHSYPPDVLGVGPPVAPSLLGVTPNVIEVDTPTPAIVEGSNFTHATVVYVDGVAQPTTYVDSETLHYVAEADTEGSQEVWVQTGALKSSSVFLTVGTGPPTRSAAMSEQGDEASTDAEVDDAPPSEASASDADEPTDPEATA